MIDLSPGFDVAFDAIQEDLDPTLPDASGTVPSLGLNLAEAEPCRTRPFSMSLSRRTLGNNLGFYAYIAPSNVQVPGKGGPSPQTFDPRQHVPVHPE